MQSASEQPSGQTVFAYPETAHECRHGPRGYLDDGHYKPWLRDEFAFRCVYCRCREVWFPDGDRNFSVEHVQPTSLVRRGSPTTRPSSMRAASATRREGRSCCPSILAVACANTWKCYLTGRFAA